MIRPGSHRTRDAHLPIQLNAHCVIAGPASLYRDATIHNTLRANQVLTFGGQFVSEDDVKRALTLRSVKASQPRD